ncbi:MAG TPA: flavodoxin [Gammaproteobacteria bacterium]|nr:flavodoxin [Gammaproteobacteria bacterium]|tara:strand:+ start:8493 stop:8963 length:471 start_codon:yes stop_codon:yes gene_type:complete
MAEKKRLLIVYYSRSGETEKMAEAVIRGARDDAIGRIDVIVKSALEASPGDVMRASGILLGTPENFGYMSGAMKLFFETIYYPCQEHTKGLPYGLFIRAGNDGQGALSSMSRIITGLSWREVAAPVIISGKFHEDRLGACSDLGMVLAAGLDAGIY